MTLTGLFLFLHVLGVVLWLGLGITLPFITGPASREENLEVAAFAYEAADRLTRTLGLSGMILTLVGGVGLTMTMGFHWFRPFPNHWLFQMQVLGILSVVVGVLYQVPLAGRLAREARASAEAGARTETFAKYRKRHAIVGSVIGGLLLIVLVLATLKP
jgi:uncharacterized membrane protein